MTKEHNNNDNPAWAPRPLGELRKESPELRDVFNQMRVTRDSLPAGRRQWGGVHDLYPRAETVVDAGLVGRAELIELAGLEGYAGRQWYSRCLRCGWLPPADGQIIDRRPTWQRKTIIPFLYLAARADGQRVLAPQFWAEAEKLLEAQGAKR